METPPAGDPVVPRHVTWAEFVEMAEASEVPLEYDRGVVTPKGEGDQRHMELAHRIYDSLRDQLRGRPCRPYMAMLGVAPAAATADQMRMRIPDVTVVCGGIEAYNWTGRDVAVAQNPRVLIEVLSPSTERVDRTVKLARYQEIASAREIVLAEKDVAAADVWRRGDDGAWPATPERYAASGAHLPLTSIGCVLDLAELHTGLPDPAPRARR